jgi:lysophospholipase L1-like esterase
MEGVNDLADRDDRVTPAVIESLRTMLRDAKSRNVRPFLATLAPEIEGGQRALAWTLIAPFNERLRALAASEGVTLVDVYTAVLSNTRLYIAPDGLHLTAEGYAKIAETFFHELSTTLERTPTLSLSPAGGGFVLQR